MKTLITSFDAKLEAKMDKRFGRTHYFCMYNEETQEVMFEKNPYLESQGGAGTKTAELMAEKGITKVISGQFGPKAKDLLEKFDIQLIEIEEELTIQEIIDKLKN